MESQTPIASHTALREFHPRPQSSEPCTHPIYPMPRLQYLPFHGPSYKPPSYKPARRTNHTQFHIFGFLQITIIRPLLNPHHLAEWWGTSMHYGQSHRRPYSDAKQQWKHVVQSYHRWIDAERNAVPNAMEFKEKQLSTRALTVARFETNNHWCIGGEKRK